ncbi:uncharacterized protein LOC132798019 [Drosophila nasuta]|uniref:uncharacterized protein LOC132798019 n=1 Tax=Drosophila nasuta TaxID=42062 RepID=UPI00295F5722|nr:uncharacterized protein LOC132798019 [Drosophila nasuta]
MGSLPRERLAHHMAPFTYTGVDYFGPIDIIVGRRHEKRWGVLFTCLTIRAVHLDIATSLSTDSFLCILKAFIARRGCPRRMMSDNGTNFRGASRVLKDEVERISTRDVETKYPEMEFMFIPPGSPHMGGAWERLVRSTKSILTEILPPGGLREEVLRAALADVEGILNSRPLTYMYHWNRQTQKRLHRTISSWATLVEFVNETAKSITVTSLPKDSEFRAS